MSEPEITFTNIISTCVRDNWKSYKLAKNKRNILSAAILIGFQWELRLFSDVLSSVRIQTDKFKQKEPREHDRIEAEIVGMKVIERKRGSEKVGFMINGNEISYAEAHLWLENNGAAVSKLKDDGSHSESTAKEPPIPMISEVKVSDIFIFFSSFVFHFFSSFHLQLNRKRME
jgi:hypothetical protein